MKKHKAIHNLGMWAHPPKSNVNFKSPPKDQTRSDSPKIIGPKGDKGKPGPQPHKAKRK
jgi:hypothetical protein